MKLHFDPNHQYQIDAVKSIIDIFEGQPLNQGDFGFSISENGQLFNENGVGNRIVLSEEQILSNLQEVQKRNGFKNISEELDGMHFSVEMETGTGKTYIYIRTIYELNKKYGFKKFVIVVPSIAIREGVLKNLEITFDHFQNLYDRIPVNFDVYDSRKVSGLRGFASSNAVQILVINIDSFAKDENVINRPNDKLTGKKPIEFIQSASPIVIVDEPQNMETEIRKKAIENLNYSCTLRYSATHTNRYNLVYNLDPVKAYDLGLVKQIEVDSIVTENDFNDAFIRLEKVSATKTRTSATLTIDINQKDGVARKTVTAKVGDDLYKLSKNRDIYKQGYIINGIDVESGYISLSNGEDLFVGDSQGGMTDELMKFQIEKTVKEHLIKEKKYKDKGIKVLSLFFIDRVANYRQYDEAGNQVNGKFAKWFEESFRDISSKTAYKGLIPFSVGEIHNGYFSQDKKGKFKDTQKTAKAKSDIDTFKLIMRDKERLLSTEEPLRFIFSHSALREGWDNPNVFQICTLNETRSELKKRQEIGRGLRLSVDQSGYRIHDPVINKLTVIANESYEDFAKQLQNEIEDECGVSFKGRIKNRKKRKEVKYRKGFELDENFKSLWDKIKHHTKYKVMYETEELIEKASKALRYMPEIKRPVIKSTKTSVKFDERGINGDVISSYSTLWDKAFRIPDILAYMQSKIGLTRSTILQILIESDRLDDVIINPQLFLDNAVAEIKEVLNDLIVEGIKYEKIGDVEYEMRLFEDYEIHVNELTFVISKKEKTIYSNMVPLDSGVEYQFAKDCETREDIDFYFKLPYWFKIKTPIGNYNPDWALIKKNEKTVYFVAETKSANQELKTSEKRKIKCGNAHFDEFEGVEYRQVAKVSDLD
ncbi:MAG: DEAD/DEAH box helicase family protein [Proteobacteria bacterium]|nr:DEAD/DEAH box helicase [Desulfobacteraceae bacterium]MBU4100853.1 DEAD/DEAH box helicase family protein [Pseudomonadota bacterium]MBU4128464.1 DEAD/DEAH box helicase family protein [Pseudomonadota bacterium]